MGFVIVAIILMMMLGGDGSNDCSVDSDSNSSNIITTFAADVVLSVDS